MKWEPSLCELLCHEEENKNTNTVGPRLSGTIGTTGLTDTE